MNERISRSLSGIPLLFALIAAYAFAIWLFIDGARSRAPGGPLLGIALFVLLAFLSKGFFQVQPNRAKVMQLFGRYVGTVREEGLRWTNPFYAKRDVSLRVRNFESSKLKVNDNDGNPIEIAAVVVWQVVDTAEAVFQVDDYENFVHIQSEAALRQMATRYPYDSHDTDSPSLRSHGKEVNAHLRDEIQERLARAGVDVVEARISHLAYAQEIAQAMLQRQQAGAIIAARSRIVEGAVSMVEMALDQLSKRGVVTLDEERKAAMVSNLLVVLCGERSTQPVVNTGTLHH
ncbi:SPFH domain-containing protein [Tahibacter soli]|jgi:regulator of protease activity HflC (stomatin/prohibitin superfamily)|uniref:SPFH domain-containing protein n=1 Tax=Tahibacter soli TaxID=2983605 RepID=A0A9X3YGL8_9GAMM|nr:SPFH domain-containing protein [Tahibacter soli]MDC8011874.1 SPFH domain-containing protein [Tahibacter soli]